MKTVQITLAMLLIFLFTGLSAQEKVKNPDKNGIYESVETMPVFPGGEEKLIEYLMKNVVYPEKAKKDSITGKVLVQFVVDENGKVINCKILKSASPLLDAEAKRVVESMPAWTPGKEKGKAVKVAYVLPIAFALK